MDDLSVLAKLGRELALACDAEGRIRFADERARRVLAAELGQPLAALAAPGTAERVHGLLDRARSRETEAELVLMANGAPTTLAVRAVPSEDGVALVLATPRNSSLADLEALQRELAVHQQQVQRLQSELGDSQRGVLVLNRELEEQGESLRHVLGHEQQMLANVTHELRTPVHAIVLMTRAMLDSRADPLSPEQTSQVRHIRRAAETLSLLIDDVLDLSKLRSGRVGLRISRFEIHDVFSAVRGMLRPLANERVALVFEEPREAPVFETDEAKLSQILRNFVSNALKFTEKGEVRVRLELTDYGAARISVRDTGVGIAPEDRARLFREFEQIPNPLQHRARGSGLGLSVSKKLARILGGDVSVQSEPGKGSTFSVTVPIVHPDVVEMHLLEERSQKVDPKRIPVLVVEDDRATQIAYERTLARAGIQAIPARSTAEARARLETVKPSAILLDVMLEDESGWALLSWLKANPELRDVPVIVASVVASEERALELGAAEFLQKPLEEQALVNRLKAVARRTALERVLVIEDDPTSRLIIQDLLKDTYDVIEAPSVAEGVARARASRPDAILLDFVLGDGDAFDVVEELRREPATRGIPVIVMSARTLSDAEQRRLADATTAFLSKRDFTKAEAVRRIKDALASAVAKPFAS